MARIRTVKPEYWSSEQILDLSIPARLLFIGLWNFCDDAGIHPASPRTLKAEVFPADNIDVVPLIEEIEAQRLIARYEVGEKPYWYITGWQHQKIDRPTFKHPLPDGTVPRSHDDVRRVFDEYSTSPHPRKGRESKGKESKGKDEKKHSSSSDDDGHRLFDLFWRAYPRKTHKKEARQAFTRLKPDRALVLEMVQALEWQQRQSEWTEDNGRFIPYPASWLQARRWEDEIPDPPVKKHSNPLFAGGR